MEILVNVDEAVKLWDSIQSSIPGAGGRRKRTHRKRKQCTHRKCKRTHRR